MFFFLPILPFLLDIFCFICLFPLYLQRFDETVQGGESILMDGFHVAQRLYDLHHDLFQVLALVPATFEKIHFDRAWPVYMRYRRPHIAVNDQTQITGIFWAPQFEGTVEPHILAVTWLDFYTVVSFCAIQTSEWVWWRHCRNGVLWLDFYCVVSFCAIQKSEWVWWRHCRNGVTWPRIEGSTIYYEEASAENNTPDVQLRQMKFLTVKFFLVLFYLSRATLSEDGKCVICPFFGRFIWHTQSRMYFVFAGIYG